MNESKDGGQAFPVLNSIQREEFDSSKGGYFQGVKSTAGMSLRDYFAGQALVAILGSPNCPVKVEEKSVAEGCYLVADAMLKARSA